MIRTYGSLIRELGLTPCHGILPTGHYCGLTPPQHARGEWTFTWRGPTVIHVLDKPITTRADPITTRADIKRFLLVCAEALDYTLGSSYDEPFWRKVYRRTIASRAVGKRLHIRVPATCYALDKLVVLSGTAGLSNDVPFRKQAYDWARR